MRGTHQTPQTTATRSRLDWRSISRSGHALAQADKRAGGCCATRIGGRFRSLGLGSHGGIQQLDDAGLVIDFEDAFELPLAAHQAQDLLCVVAQHQDIGGDGDLNRMSMRSLSARAGKPQPAGGWRIVFDGAARAHALFKLGTVSGAAYR